MATKNDTQENEHDEVNDKAKDSMLIIAENIRQSHFQQSDVQSRKIAESKLHANRASSFLVLVLSIVFIGLIISSSFIHIEEISSARGELVSISNVEFVQHLEGGMIDKYYVHRGDIIQKGDLIATLKDYSRESTNTISRKRLAIEYLAKARLNALLTNKKPKFDHLTKDNDLVDAQKMLYERTMSDQNQEDRYYVEIIHNKNDVLKSMNARLRSAKKQLNLLNEQVKMREKSYKNHGSSKLEVTDAKIARINMKREIQSLTENILNTKATISETYIQKQQAKTTRQLKYHNEFQEVQAKIAELVETRKVDKDKELRLDVRSPVYGVVRDLPIYYSSAVVAGGGVIAEIVPLKEGLKANVHIKPKDIGFVAVGQKVDLKFDSFDYSKFGSVAGVISRINTGTLKDPKTNEVYYLGEVTLDKAFITSNGHKYALVPGMEMTADIKMGERRALSYILKPIMYGLQLAIREKKI